MQKSATWNGKPRTAPATGLCRPLELLGAAVLVIITYSCTRFVLEIPRQACQCGQNSRLILPQERGGYGEDRRLVEISGHELWWPERGYGVQLNLRIYVYDVEEIEGLRELVSGRDHSIAASSCMKGQWGTQVKIHKFLMESRYRTLNKSQADFFFVPAYVKCVRMFGGLKEREVNDHFLKILKQMPYFHRSGGRDHIFVFPSGSGAHLVKDWPIFLNRSIFLTPEGDRTDKKEFSSFNTWKDIIIPGNVDTKNHFAKLAPLALSERKYVANYLGRAQGKKGRLQLLELAKQFPSELDAPELAFQGPAKLERIDYYKRLRTAKFCLAPRGESSWTLRFYEAFFVECVPVILSDEVELPYQNVLDYSEFSIKWPSSRINEELLAYLRSIPEYEIERMLARGRTVRCLFTYAPDSGGCTAMTGILWELQRKVRTFHQYHHSFWLHNASLVNQDLVKFLDWIPPFPVP